MRRLCALYFMAIIMKTHICHLTGGSLMKSIKYRVLLSSSAIVLGCLLSAGAQARLADPEASGPVMQLGTVEVSGQQQIIAALQAIKLALKQPESSDAAQQNTIVCRVEKDIGTHGQDMLTCATNRTLSQRRQSIQSGMLGGCESVNGTSCYADQAFSDRSPLNSALRSSAGHVLHMPVNGASLRQLLAKIPDPAPEASTAPAPAAATSPGHG